jgi:chromosome segregation ATPase
MTELERAVGTAGKLKQMCEAVLTVVNAAEQMGSISQTISERQGHLSRLQDEIASAQVALLDARRELDNASKEAKVIVSMARTQADALLAESRAKTAQQIEDAKQAAKSAYESKAHADAEVVAQRQVLAAIQQEIRKEEQVLADARRAIQELLKR